jgi:hypothetical protein
MKKLNENKIVAIVVLLSFLAFGSLLPVSAFAATTPSLGMAGTFGILSSTFTRNVGLTTVTGDIGYTTLSGSGTDAVLSGTDYGSSVPYSQAGTDESTALTALNVQACTFTFANGPIDLATDTTHGPLGVYTPGVYCTGTSSAASIGTAGITLNGSGTYIFIINGAFTSVNNSNVTLTGGATPCDVFWTPTSATTLGSNSTLTGTIIDDSGVTIGNNTTLTGRALSFGGTVTTDTDTITSTCGAPAPTPPVVQGSGGGQLYAAPLISILKIPTPLVLPSGPGSVTYNYTVSNPGTVALSNVTVVDNKCPVINFLSGDTNGDAKLDTNETWHYACTSTLSQTTTNSATATGQASGLTAIDVANATVVVGTPGLPNAGVVPPPLIHVIKTPNVFTVPYNGAVTYTYTVSNPGVVPLSNVSVADDKCSPVVGYSGDLNQNNLLDPSETWTYTCRTNLTASTTNTATAEGSADGYNAMDYSVATVLVSVPGFPKTGYPPEKSSIPLNIIILAGILLVTVASGVVVLKRQA